MLEDLMWVEKYRPTELEQMALGDENRTLLQGYLAAGQIPHLLLSGPPGIGKTTLAKVMTAQLDCKVLLLNASNERGIDTIRSKVGTFVRGLLGPKWNIVILDEADAMTHDAQTALRNMMETNADRARFILTCNFTHKIIEPIQSRCVPVSLAEMDLKARADVLVRILKEEEVDHDAAGVIGFAERYLDLRKMIMGAQKSILTHGRLVPPATSDVTGQALFEAIQGHDWSALRSMAKQDGFDHTESLKALFWSIPEDHPTAASMRVITAKAIHESGWSPDPVILFLGTVSELMGEV